MGGINSLSGLTKVNVDCRPQVGPDAPNVDNGPQPQPGEDIIQINDPAPANAKSMIRQLDTLLLNAASKSVSASAAAKMDEIGEKLHSNFLNDQETEELDRLAKDATDKLRALDNFSGRELSKALMTKSGDLVWRKGFFGGMSRVTTAVKAAVEAQEALSEVLAKLNERIAKDDAVDFETQEVFIELQFQCDRRATEIYSIIVRMHDLAQQDVARRQINADPRVREYLDATFKELMPREAILMHGTAEALETMKAKFAESMRPLAEKLNAFAADGKKTLSVQEVAELDAAMATMKNTLAHVRKNGIEIQHYAKDEDDGIIHLDGEEQKRKVASVSHTEVDKTILDEMEKALAAAKEQIDAAKQESVERARRAFHRDLLKTFDLERLPNGNTVMFGGGDNNPVLKRFVDATAKLATLLEQFETGARPMAQFNEAFRICVMDFPKRDSLQNEMVNMGFDKDVAKSFSKMVSEIDIVAAQFKELMRLGDDLAANAADSSLVAEDVRTIMLGEGKLSVYVEAKSRGYQRGDVDPKTDETNIESSRRLGSGITGTAYLLTTKSGEEFVFKPELGSRIGLSGLALGATGNYLETQTTANLNIATQKTAEAFGCEDLVVKYSVGVHDGQFGVFMEKAKGYSGEDIAFRKGDSGNGGIAPVDLRNRIASTVERQRVKAQVAQKLNRLQWLDIITGQGDRHWGNYFVHINEHNHEVTVKAIDNDASFSATRTGAQKYELSGGYDQLFISVLSNTCKAIHHKDAPIELRNRVLKDPGLTIDQANRKVTVDLSKAVSPELGLAIVQTVGAKSIAMPQEIDKEFYDRLIEMDTTPAKKQAYLQSIAPRISPEALRAAEMRLDDAIAHAKKLASQNKVYTDEHWNNPHTLSRMPDIEEEMKIVKYDGTVKKVSDKALKGVRDYVENNTPSYYKRDNFQLMFQ